MPTKKDIVPQVVGVQYLADITGLSVKTLNNYTHDGMPKQSFGKYPLRECIQFVIAQAVRKSRGVSKERERTKEEVDMRKKTADAMKSEFLLAQARGEVISTKTANKVFGEKLGKLRETMRQIPGRFGAEMIGHTDEREAQMKLNELVDDMMKTQLAQALEAPDFQQIVLEEQNEEEEGSSMD